MRISDMHPGRLVVLDRDGVINEDSEAFVKSPSEWRPLPGSLEALGLLSQSGFTVAVASNQSGVARELFDKKTLHSIHRKMRRAAKRAGGSIDRIVYCPHLPTAGCDCRKPEPGMLTALANHYGVSMRGVPVVGDSARDIEAARAVGARPILVLTGNGEATRDAMNAEAEVETYPDLLAVARALVAEQTHFDTP